MKNSIAWFLSAELVRYEYVRRHGQAVYSHKLFWSSKVLALVISISVDSFYHGAQDYLNVLKILACGLLVMVMLVRPRLVHIGTPEMNRDTRVTTNFEEELITRGPSIETKLFPKVKTIVSTEKTGGAQQQFEKVVVFEFEVTINKRTPHKVRRSFAEFLEVESFLKGEFEKGNLRSLPPAIK